ncbi:CHAT domain-containing protein [Nonomuraea rubra]
MRGSREYLVHEAISLMLDGQFDAAAERFRAATRLVPEDGNVWWGLASVLPAEAEERFEAIARFVQLSDNALFLGLAEQILRDAGREVPERQGVPSDIDPVQLLIERDGMRTLVFLDNTTGLSPREVLESIERFSGKPDWLQAYQYFAAHPELADPLVRTILRYQAGESELSEDVVRARTNVQVLRRAEEIGAEAAFAEADGTPAGEFRRLIRAYRDIQPVLAAMAEDPDRDPLRFLDRHPGLSQDDDTYLLLARISEIGGDDQRDAVVWMRLLLEEHARTGEPPPPPTAARRLIEDVQRLAAGGGDLAEGIGALRRGLADPDPMSDRDRRDLNILLGRLLASLGGARGERDLAAEAAALLRRTWPEVSPGSAEDATVTITLAEMALHQTRDDGLDRLGDAAALLEQCRERVGPLRSQDAPLLECLGQIRRVQTLSTGDPETAGEAVRLYTTAALLRPRTGPGWAVNQIGLLEALLLQATLTPHADLRRSQAIAEELIQRHGDDPGRREFVWDAAARVASALYDRDGDLVALDTAIERYLVSLSLPETRQPMRRQAANNLVSALGRRYAATGDPADLAEGERIGLRLLSTLDDRSPLAVLTRRNVTRMYLSHLDRITADQAASCVRMLRHDWRTLPHGRERFFTAINLYDTVRQLRLPVTEDVNADASEALRYAMAILDTGDHPTTAVTFCGSIGLDLAALGEWGAAGAAFARVQVALESLPGQPGGERWLAGQSASLDRLCRVAAYCAAGGGDPEAGVLWLERNRARALRRALALDSSRLVALAEAGHGDLADAYAKRIGEMTMEMDEADANPFLVERRHRLQAELAALAARIRQAPGFERFATEPVIQDVYDAARTTATAHVATTAAGGVAFVAGRGGDQVSALALPELTDETVEVHLRTYLEALEAYRAGTDPALFGAVLENLSAWMEQAVLAPIRRLLPGEPVITLILSGKLGMLPLIPGEDTTPCFALAPSSAALVAAGQALTRAGSRAPLAVVDPRPSSAAELPWAGVEHAALARRHPDLVSLAGPDATAEAVARAWPRHGSIHFACHGLALPDRPRDSHLLLAGDARLTVTDLQRGRPLWGVRLCYLSACDTAIAGTTDPNEALGLPSALIQIGAAGVVAAQWPIADMAAAVLAVKFYDLWDHGSHPAPALHRAQRWLRDAGRSDISRLLHAAAPGLPGLPALLAELPLAPRPFAAPYFWAAFCYTGL